MVDNLKKAKRPFVLWFTGLSGSGKSTVSDAVCEKLAGMGLEFEMLDGDVLRGVFPRTGFDRQSRDDHIKRVGYMSSLLEKHGVCIVASFISPYREARGFVRGLCGNFIEVYVSASLDECRRRDVKGLYKKALAGEIENFTGVSDPYEPPESPELVLDTEKETLEESVEKVMNYIKGYI